MNEFQNKALKEFQFECTENKCANLPTIEVNKKYKLIMLSISLGNDKLAEFLIKQGLNISSADNDGNTCLHYAAMSGENK